MSDKQLPQHVIDAFWQRWGNNTFAEGELLDVQGRTCATAKGIWRVFWPREPAPAQP